MSAATRWNYYRRIFSAYFLSDSGPDEPVDVLARDAGRSIRAPMPADSANTTCCFARKRTTRGTMMLPAFPCSITAGAIGLQYNPIAIAQWGLANYNRFCETGETLDGRNTLKAADWLDGEPGAECSWALGLEPSF